MAAPAADPTEKIFACMLQGRYPPIGRMGV
jgi:hypothetical protein